MVSLQFTLSPEEGKELIAQSIYKHPLFVKTRKSGRTLLKGGATISRLSVMITDNLYEFLTEEL